MTGKQWTALGLLGSGLLGVGVMALFATGRSKEAYAIAGSAALVSAILVSAHALDADQAPPAHAGGAATPAAFGLPV